MKKQGIWFVIVIVMLAATLTMNKDAYLTGDEVVTYGMANSSTGGWMLSSGRVSDYFQNEILGDSAGDTFKNVVSFAEDIISNKKQAAYFSYKRPTESGWYDNEETTNWFYVTESDRFTFGRVYLNAMGDDANSFLYYMSVHLISSVIPALSATKWSAFIVNVICLGVSLFLLYKISAYFTDKNKYKLLVCLIYGFSVASLDLTTYLRTYMLTTAIQLALFLLHLKLFNAICNGEKNRFKKYITILLILYPLGYVAHYTTGLWAVTLGISTLIFIIQNVSKDERNYYLIRYIILGLAAVALGIMLDPVSVLGLSSKLSGTNTGLLKSMISTVNAFITNVFGNWIVCIVIIIFLMCGAFYLQKKHTERNNVNAITKLSIILTIYCIFIMVVMKQDYFKAVYPLICMVIVLSICEIYAAAFSDSKGIRYVLYLLVCVYIGSNVGYVISQKESEKEAYTDIQDALSTIDTDNLIFLRNHASAYDYFVLMPDYDKVLVITTDEDDLKEYISYDSFQKDKEYAVLITNGDENLEAFEKTAIENLDVEVLTICYKAEAASVIRLKVK